MTSLSGGLSSLSTPSEDSSTSTTASSLTTLTPSEDSAEDSAEDSSTSTTASASASTTTPTAVSTSRWYPKVIEPLFEYHPITQGEFPPGYIHDSEYSKKSTSHFRGFGYLPEQNPLFEYFQISSNGPFSLQIARSCGTSGEFQQIPPSQYHSKTSYQGIHDQKFIAGAPLFGKLVIDKSKFKKPKKKTTNVLSAVLCCSVIEVNRVENKKHYGQAAFGLVGAVVDVLVAATTETNYIFPGNRKVLFEIRIPLVRSHTRLSELKNEYCFALRIPQFCPGSSLHTYGPNHWVEQRTSLQIHGLPKGELQIKKTHATQNAARLQIRLGIIPHPKILREVYHSTGIQVQSTKKVYHGDKHHTMTITATAEDSLVTNKPVYVTLFVDNPTLKQLQLYAKINIAYKFRHGSKKQSFLAREHAIVPLPEYYLENAFPLNTNPAELLSPIAWIEHLSNDTFKGVSEKGRPVIPPESSKTIRLGISPIKFPVISPGFKLSVSSVKATVRIQVKHKFSLHHHSIQFPLQFCPDFRI